MCVQGQWCPGLIALKIRIQAGQQRLILRIRQGKIVNPLDRGDIPRHIQMQHRPVARQRRPDCLWLQIGIAACRGVERLGSPAHQQPLGFRRIYRHPGGFGKTIARAQFGRDRQQKVIMDRRAGKSDQNICAGGKIGMFAGDQRPRKPRRDIQQRQADNARDRPQPDSGAQQLIP